MFRAASGVEAQAATKTDSTSTLANFKFLKDLTLILHAQIVAKLGKLGAQEYPVRVAAFVNVSTIVGEIRR